MFDRKNTSTQPQGIANSAVCLKFGVCNSLRKKNTIFCVNDWKCF